MRKKKKNRAAVHLGKLSAKSRKAKCGSVKAFREKMAEIRSFGRQKSLSTSVSEKRLTNASK